MADSDQDHIVSGVDRTMKVDVPTELGSYGLTKMLGRGGMGEVWQAFDKSLERDVAIKLMRSELLGNEEAVKRFQREARAVARLNHPNIVQVYSFGEQSGVVYFAMELVEGETVTQRLKRKGPLPLEECVYILLQAIEGLSYANARGIIHRDIKPSNLMLTPDFRTKITDFGLAKMIEHDTQMTATGTSMGSPNYMSPEQARGQEADHRSDIYALGITLYQMLLNQLPFAADTPLTVLLKQIQEPLPEPADLKKLNEGRVLAVIKRMVEKEPDARFQTYGGLAAAIANLAPDVQLRSSALAATASLATPQESVSPPPLPASPGEATDSLFGEESLRVSGEPMKEIALHQQAPPRPKRFSAPVIAAFIGGLALLGFGVFYTTKAILEYERKPAATSVASPVASPAVVAESPTPSPTAAPAATTAPTVPTATPAVLVPTPGSVQPTRVAVAPTMAVPPPTLPSGVPVLSPPDATPIPTLTPFPTPTPDRGISVNEVIVGTASSYPGQTFELRALDNTHTLDVPAGTVVELIRTEQTPPQYVVRFRSNIYYLPLESGRMNIPSERAGTAAATPGPKSPQAARIILLKTADGKPGMVPLYRDPVGLKSLRELTAGTRLNVVEEAESTLKVVLPEGGFAYVYKRNTEPAP